MTGERWRAVPGFEGLYEVSDHGRVRSLPRVVWCEGPVKGRYASNKPGRLLRPGTMTAGHLSVCLGRGGSRCVHELVLSAFVGPPPTKCEARHLDGDEKNNRLENLIWDTRGNNGRDKKWHNGATTYKLSPSSIKYIKRKLAAPYYGVGADLARRFDVSHSAISCIKYNKVHSDVTVD